MFAWTGDACVLRLLKSVVDIKDEEIVVFVDVDGALSELEEEEGLEFKFSTCVLLILRFQWYT